MKLRLLGGSLRSELEEPLAKGWLGAVVIAALTLASLPIIVTYTLLVVTSFADKLVVSPWTDFQVTLMNWKMFFEGRLSTTAAKIYTTGYVLKMIWNTFVVAAGVTGVVALTSIPAAYTISRMNFRGRSPLMKLLILLHAFPGVALIIAVYAMFVATLKHIPKEYFVLYSFVYVIVARASLEIPMAIWILKGFFDRVPWEVEWAAIVDGASRLRTLYQVVLPVVKPGIAAVAIFAFLAGWEELIYVLVFLPPEEKTLATFIDSQLGSASLELAYLPVVAAAATLYLIPTIVFFIFTQRLLLETMAGGLKG